MQTTVLFSRFVLLLAVVGFGVQLVWVSMQFFSFAIMYRVQQIRSRVILPISLSLCLPYNEVMGSTALQVADMTIRQILEGTPATDQLLISCRHRDENGLLHDLSKGACDKIFEVKKSLVQGNVCYLITERVRTLLVMELVTHALVEPFLVMEVSLSHIFDNVSRFHAIPSGKAFPLISRDYTDVTYFKRKVNGHGFKANISPSWISVIDLPFPYETKCAERVVGKNSPFFGCIVTCIKTNIAKLGRVPFTEYISKPRDMRFVSNDDMKNSTFASQVRAVYEVSAYRHNNIN